MSKRQVYLLTMLLVLLGVVFVLSLTLGSVSIPVKDILGLLLGQSSSNDVWDKIFWQIRLPRSLTALLAGAALSMSGLLMQSFFRNPIAGPYVLGISSGAGLGVAVWIMGAGVLLELGLVSTSFLYHSWALVLAACLGAGLVLLLVLLIAWRMRDVNVLLILGLMLGTAVSALVMLLQFFSGREELQRFVLWTMGDLSAVGWGDLGILIPVILAGLVAAWILAQPLNVLLMGEAYAKTLGVAMARLRWQVILITALLAGSITAFCGPIAFVGIAVPQIARLLMRSQRHQVLMPITILLGMLVLLACQLIAQLPMQDKILPINAVSSLLGAPVVVWIVFYLNKSR